MKPVILIIPLLILNCATADITVDRAAMKSIKTVAIVPFRSSVGVKNEILTESAEKFRTAFVNMNYQVIEKEKTGLLLKDYQFPVKGFTSEDVKTAGKLLGADAILTGEITDYGITEFPSPFVSVHRSGIWRHHPDDEEIKPRIIFRFQVVIRLLNVSDGAVIITIKNRYKGEASTMRKCRDTTLWIHTGT